MKNTQILKELKDMDIKALTKELALTNGKLTKLKTDLAFRKLKDIKQIFKTRRYIAQIWTMLNQAVNQKAIEEIAKQEVVK